MEKYSPLGCGRKIKGCGGQPRPAIEVSILLHIASSCEPIHIGCPLTGLYLNMMWAGEGAIGKTGQSQKDSY